MADEGLEGTNRDGTMVNTRIDSSIKTETDRKEKKNGRVGGRARL